MTYLIGEIALFLLLALALGLVAGWLLRGLVISRDASGQDQPNDQEGDQRSVWP